MTSRKTPTITMPEEMVSEIDDRLEYGDSRAAWIREAVRQRLKRNGVNFEEDDGLEA